jgi:FixJ family two-component response regulator
MYHGWGFATKSGNADISEIAQNLISVAQGRNLQPVAGDKIESTSDTRLARYSKLSERQRATMKLAAQGYTPKAIGERLGISYDLARQELSRSYKILVPVAAEDQVLSIAAILEFNSIREELESVSEVNS